MRPLVLAGALLALGTTTGGVQSDPLACLGDTDAAQAPQLPGPPARFGIDRRADTGQIGPAPAPGLPEDPTWHLAKLEELRPPGASPARPTRRPAERRRPRKLPRVFDHVTSRVSDRKASERFYDTVLGVLGIEAEYSDDQFTEWDDFSLTAATAWSPVTRGLHIAFGTSSRERVDEFWAVGTAAGYRSDGEPGPRPEYSADYYGGFLLDPDGNSIEAVHHEDVRHGIDHLWIRVRSVEASKRFYETIAAHAGFRLHTDTPERASFDSDPGSFSVLSGAHLTENLHMAFPGSTNEAVDAFHTAAIEAGYGDNGTPGERTQYHRGYYSAYVLDPDRNNVELVNHNR